MTQRHVCKYRDVYRSKGNGSDGQADDARYRRLCERYVPTLENHQKMLEEYGKSVGAEGATGLKGAIGAVIGKARDVVDAMRETDFLRLVGDIVMGIVGAFVDVE